MLGDDNIGFAAFAYIDMFVFVVVCGFRTSGECGSFCSEFVVLLKFGTVTGEFSPELLNLS